MGQGGDGNFWLIAYIALAAVLVSGAIAGIRQGKFALGRRLGLKPYTISKDEKPALFWLVALILTGLGLLPLFLQLIAEP